MNRIEQIPGFTAEAIAKSYYPLDQIMPEHDPNLGPEYIGLYDAWGMQMVSGIAVLSRSMTVRNAIGQLGLNTKKNIEAGAVSLGPLIFDNGNLLHGIGLWALKPQRLIL
jgi:hypothetical protein